MSATNTNTFTYDADFPLAAAALAAGQGFAATTNATAYTTAATTYTQAQLAANQFSWQQQLLLPAIQAAANILILEYQKKQYDEIEERRIGYIEAAVEQHCECIEELQKDLKDATDDVPAPAMYQPFSPADEARNTICDNVRLVPALKKYARMIDENRTETDLARAIAINPNYTRNSEIAWTSIEALMNGDLPIGLTVETLTKSAEGSVVNGRLGCAAGQFRRNIGLVDYRVQKAAREERRVEIALNNSIMSPADSQVDIEEMMTKPEVRFSYALQQAQLIQNSLQNANNACARKAPYLMQQLQVQLQKCTQQMQLEAGKAGLVNSFVPNFAGVLNSQIRDLSNGIVNGLGAVTNGIGGGNPGTGILGASTAGNFGGSSFQNTGFTSSGLGGLNGGLV